MKRTDRSHTSYDPTDALRRSGFFSLSLEALDLFDERPHLFAKDNRISVDTRQLFG